MNTLANNTTRKSTILPGFEGLNRFHSREYDMDIIKILPGEYYVTREDEIIATVLGSCVSVCMRDTKVGIGGMNHFMLPENNRRDDDSWKCSKIDKAARYGVDAMEHLVNEILKHGGKKNNFEIKLCGGGKIMSAMNDIGRKNIDFIKHYLDMEGYDIASEDLGSNNPRKVRYFPKTGKLQIMKLRSLHNNTIVEREVNFQKELKVAPVSGEVELF
jgi:chemotaxis protein CheD